MAFSSLYSESFIGTITNICNQSKHPQFTYELVIPEKIVTFQPHLNDIVRENDDIHKTFPAHIYGCCLNLGFSPGFFLDEISL